MQNKDLSKFLKEIGLKADYNIEEDLGEGYVKLKISEAERRQALQDINCVEDVVKELLRNSRDAKSKRIFISTKKIGNRYRIINCLDDGVGIPPRFHEMIFASRVTSKLENGKKDNFGFHGRGMALFSIKLNVDEIKIVFSDHGIGASFFAKIDLENIPEKKDQSSFPDVTKKVGFYEVTGGVNNIHKTIFEFQTHNPDIDFYLGTQAQILSTIRYLTSRIITEIENDIILDRSLIGDFLISNKHNIIDLAGAANDYNSLNYIAKDIFGMDISERNIQRVFYDEIEPLRPLKDHISLLALDSAMEDTTFKNKEDKEKIQKKRLKLKDETDISKIFKDEDIKDIKIFLKNIINKIGKKYFITTNNDIECYRKENTLKLTVELKQKE